MRRSIVIAGLVALLAGVVAWWIPYLTRDRDYAAAVVQASPIEAPAVVVVQATQRACFGPVSITTDSGQARFQVGTYFRPGPPIEMTITGPGYHVRRAVAAGYADNATMRLDVPAPARDLSVDVCIADRGPRRIALHASADRTKMPFVTRVAGRTQGANPAFAFYSAKPLTIVDGLPRIVERIGLFKPGVIGAWLLWPLLFATVLVVPLAALWALRRAVVEDGDEEPVRTPAA
jgi:hypothetical protein